MAQQPASVRRSLRSFAWAGAICALVPLTNAGEKVRFSDTKTPPTRPEGSLSRPGRSDNPFGGLLDRDSSLSGVTAPPFAPPAQGPIKPLTPRERDLLEKRTRWIERSPDDISINEKNANDAMGVRDYDLGEKTLLDKDLGMFDNAKTQKSNDQKSLRQREELKAKNQAAEADRDNQDKDSRDPDSRDTTIDFNKEMPHFEADMTTAATPEADRFGRVGRDFDHDSMSARVPAGGGITGMMRSSDRPSFINKAAEARSEEFQKLLGTAPADSTVPGLKLGGLDSLTFQTDLTRQEINPVVVNGPAQGSSGLRPSLAETARPFAPPASVAASFTESLLPRAAAPALGGPAFSPIQDRRPLERSPLVLEAPKRTF